jgi:hypothetical protein
MAYLAEVAQFPESEICLSYVRGVHQVPEGHGDFILMAASAMLLGIQKKNSKDK